MVGFSSRSQTTFTAVNKCITQVESVRYTYMRLKCPIQRYFTITSSPRQFALNWSLRLNLPSYPLTPHTFTLPNGPLISSDGLQWSVPLYPILPPPPANQCIYGLLGSINHTGCLIIFANLEQSSIEFVGKQLPLGCMKCHVFTGPKNKETNSAVYSIQCGSSTLHQYSAVRVSLL